MRSLILEAAVRYLIPLQILFSLFLMLRGHNAPGGGFVGGLVAAASFTLYAIAYGVDQARDVLPVPPRNLIGLGLLFALSSGIFSLLHGEAFMTGLWLEYDIQVIHHLGTPFVFDVGVYVLVIGVTLTIVFTLAEEEADAEIRDIKANLMMPIQPIIPPPLDE